MGFSTRLEDDDYDDITTGVQNYLYILVMNIMPKGLCSLRLTMIKTVQSFCQMSWHMAYCSRTFSNYVMFHDQSEVTIIHFEINRIS
jgi:hypothetical protein